MLYYAVRLIGFVLMVLPRRAVLFVGRRLGRLGYFLNNKRARIAYVNLKRSLGDEKTPQELKAIAKRSFERLGENLLELFLIPSLNKDNIDRIVPMRGIENTKSALEKGKGLVYLTAHFGNWEYPGISSALHGFPVKALVRKQKPESLNRLLNEYRQSKGCRMISKGMATREMLKGLKNNEPIGILADQDAGKNGIFIELFGRLASFHAGAIQFALKAECDILPSFIARQKDGTHILTTQEPINFERSGEDEISVKSGLKAFASILESWVRRYPDHWLWMHKRWKSSPTKAIIVLSDGKKGHLNQSLKIARLVEESYKLQVISDKFKDRAGEILSSGVPIIQTKVVEVVFKNRLRRAMFDILSIFSSRRCQGCLRCLKYALTEDSYKGVSKLSGELVISCGASTSGVNRILAYENDAKSIVIMRPAILSAKRFDLVIAHPHDKIKGENVVRLDAAPSGISKDEMDTSASALRSSLTLENGSLNIGLLIGGDSKENILSAEIVERALEGVREAAESTRGNLFVTTSRRSSKEIEGIVKSRTLGCSGLKLLVIANEDNPKDAYPGILGLSDILVVSGESVSMVSEAVASGKRVIVFRPDKISDKHERFLDSLSEKGLVDIVEAEDIGERIVNSTPQPSLLPMGEKEWMRGLKEALSRFEF